MTHYIIEVTRNAMVADVSGPPIPFVITTRSRPFSTLTAAQCIESVIRRNARVISTRIVPE